MKQNSVQEPDSAQPGICVNGRALYGTLTGVQRYTREVVSRLENQLYILSPAALFRSGIRAHAWEQAVLPLRCQNNLLWSPAGTGPLGHAKQVVTVHDVAPLEHPEWFSRRFAHFYGWLLPHLVQRVRHIICISNFTRDRLMATTSVAESRITVIPHGVDKRFLPQDEEACRNMRQALNLPPGRYILSLGSLEPRKNLARLLKSWAMINQSLPDDFSLLIAGAGGKSRVFAPATLPSDNRNVHFLGHIPEVYLPSLLSHAYIFVYPSLYEGFGLPPLEALACGVPVVTGNIGALPEVVGKAGLTVDPFSCAAIAEGIKTLVSNQQLYAQLQARARPQAARFNWNDTARATLQLLFMQAKL